MKVFKLLALTAILTTSATQAAQGYPESSKFEPGTAAALGESAVYCLRDAYFMQAVDERMRSPVSELTQANIATLTSAINKMVPAEKAREMARGMQESTDYQMQLNERDVKDGLYTWSEIQSDIGGWWFDDHGATSYGKSCGVVVSEIESIKW
ncbi:hypothetical protein [Agarivorans sp. JK6]|uniref:hypothetical protein n=1 Tax=Agarivorans sp. JK6 TaxID=2997426 RepID=UPI0038732D89